MKTKKIIRIITLVPLSLYLIYCCYTLIVNKGQTPTYVDCGRVVSKSTDEIVIKHGTQTELYLNVQFNKNGFRSIECEPTTYFSKKVGDNVCFTFNTNDRPCMRFNMFIGFATLVISFIIGVGCFVAYLVED